MQQYSLQLDVLYITFQAAHEVIVYTIEDNFFLSVNLSKHFINFDQLVNVYHSSQKQEPSTFSADFIYIYYLFVFIFNYISKSDNKSLAWFPCNISYDVKSNTADVLHKVSGARSIKRFNSSIAYCVNFCLLLIPYL
jgi:hypothetical protein